MSDRAPSPSRWRLVRDVVVFQSKCGLEAVLELTRIPVSLAAAGLDLVFGNWRRPRWFHRVLRFGERCEERINLWGVADSAVVGPQDDVDVLMRGIETVMRNPRTGPDKVRELRRWVATRIAPADDTGNNDGGTR